MNATIPDHMLRARVVRPGEVVCETVPVPEPGPDGALVKVESCGICGSDVHGYLGRHPFISLPVVPGHEFAGTVAAVGNRVAGIAAGDRVTVEPSLACGRCYSCRAGRYNICRDLLVLGCQADGAQAEYIAVPAANVVKLPEAEPMDWVTAAMIEPTAVAVGAVRKAGRDLRGAEVVVLGSGTIGLLVQQVARAYGARVAATDVLAPRLALSRRLGSDIQVDTSDPGADVWRAFGEEGPALVFECSGVPSVMREAVEKVRKGARIVVVSVWHHDALIPMKYVQDREIEIVGTLMYMRPDFEEAIRLIASGLVLVSPLVSRVIPLPQIALGYELLIRHPGETVKVVVKGLA